MIPFGEYVHQRFGGKLSAGAHRPGSGAACVLEAASAWLGLPWTDDPSLLRTPDIRPLNDAPWPSDAARARAMTRLYSALADWARWPEKRQRRFARLVTLRVIREVLPETLRTVARRPDWARRLKRVETLPAAAEALDAVFKDMIAFENKDAPNVSAVEDAHSAISFLAWAARAAHQNDVLQATRDSALAVDACALAVIDINPGQAPRTLRRAARIWREEACQGQDVGS